MLDVPQLCQGIDCFFRDGCALELGSMYNFVSSGWEFVVMGSAQALV